MSPLRSSFLAQVLLSPCAYKKPEEAVVITVRVNVGPSAAPAEFGLSHRAYVEAWRSPTITGIDTGAYRVDRPGNRGLVGSMVKLVSGLGRRGPPR